MISIINIVKAVYTLAMNKTPRLLHDSFLGRTGQLLKLTNNRCIKVLITVNEIINTFIKVRYRIKIS